MKFKIVQFTEDDQQLLWTVPSSWEKNGKLLYPECSRSKLDKLRRDATSIPEPNWISVNCLVKRSGFPSFKAAEHINKNMSDVSDTETETGENAKCSLPQQPRSSNHREENIDFNDLVRSCVGNGSQMNQMNPPSVVDAEVVIINEQDTSPKLSIAEQPTNEISLPELLKNTSSAVITNDQFNYLKSKIEGLTTSVTSVLTNQEVLYSNQTVVLQKLADISTQFDEFIKRTSQSVQMVTPKRAVNVVKITDKKSFDDFEESLKNKETAQEIKKSLSVICGQGKGRAINNAYAVMDAMFDRKFLVGCSWAGGTRAEGSKICFKSYQNTIDLFFDVVYLSDKEFTKLECSNFLKGVLRNSKKRHDSQNIRASHQKKRATKLEVIPKIPIEQAKEGLHNNSGVNDSDKGLESDESQGLC